METTSKTHRIHFGSNEPYKGFTLCSTRFERKGKQVWFQFRIGTGAGYRFVDFPGYSHSIHAPWYQKLTISGRTFTVGTHVTDRRESRRPRKVRRGFYITGMSRKCNTHVYPGWY